MNLEEIEKAVNDGITVFYKSKSYMVIKGVSELLIKCTFNNSCVGITKNMPESDFFIEGSLVKKEAIKAALYDGFNSASAAKRRAAPDNLEMFSIEINAWYTGYDFASSNGFNDGLIDRSLTDGLAEYANNIEG